MPTARLITDPGDLPALALAWHDLWLKTPGATFFQTLDWLLAYWKHYGATQQLRVIVVEELGRPIGILPLTIIPEATAIGAVSLLTYPLHNWGPFYGPLGPAPRETLAEALKLLARLPRDWELFDLRWIDHEAGGREVLAATEAAGFDAAEVHWQDLYQVDLTGGWDAYFASRSSGFRNNIRRAAKRVKAAGRLELVRYRPGGTLAGDDDPRLDLYDACVALAEKSWQGSSYTGTTLSHADIRDFLRDAHVAAARTGTLDLCLLQLDGRPVAFAYNYHKDGYVFGLRAGWDPDYAETGLGTYLYAECLEDSCRLGDRIYDLGPYYFDVKQRWINRVTQTHRVRHYPLFSPRAQLLRLKHWLTEPREALAT